MAPLSSSSSKSSSQSHVSFETVDNEFAAESSTADNDFATEFSPSGSEAGSEDDEAQDVPISSIRKREQYSKFNSWLNAKAEEVVKEEIEEVVDPANEELLSIRKLMARQDAANVLINDAREYQVELFERAKKQNIVAVLDTGAGKTLIAVLLLRHVLDEELTYRQLGRKPKIAFFLVDCVTLVFQQFAVLESNLGHRIERFCGEMGCDLWSKAVWEKHFEDNMVIVCTAEILYQCLMHSFVTLDQINLLVFDEAHHAKKNHAYARIIKDFYIPELNPDNKPRIFGMTASPVDANEDVVHAARELEAMLDCQIATTSDLSLVRKAISRPQENIVEYGRLRSPYLTQLGQALRDRFGELDVLAKLFDSARLASAELGEWCADRLWEVVFLGQNELLKLERLVEGTCESERGSRPVEQRDADLVLLRQAREFVASWNFVSPQPVESLLSSKALALLSALLATYAEDENAKSIVFVKRRYTARLLGDLLSSGPEISPPNLRVGLLIGTRYGDPGDVRFSFRQQIITLNKFRKGEINCLLATSIAEEGLDIPDCNTVVRFDLYDTMIQYIQSRGRARHMDSTYLHMIEVGNQLHLKSFTDVRTGELKMRQFCAALPADRLLQGNDCDLHKVLAKEMNMKKYTDPETGAKLTYSSSLVVLSHFISCLPPIEGAIGKATFIVTWEYKQFQCEVQLPETSPVRFAVGHPASKKSIAKRSAAFEACVLLRKGGHLDGNLIPTYHKRLPTMRNAQLALSMKQSNSYLMITKPRVWEETRGSHPEELFLTVLELQSPELLGRSYQPLALLTRTQLPKFPSFPLYLQPEQTSQLISKSIRRSMKLAASTVAKLNCFTLRVYKDVFNKEFEDNIPKMSYWLAPIRSHQVVREDEQSPESLIDWPVVDECNQLAEYRWEPELPNSFLENRYFVDRWSGGRRFFSHEAVSGLRPDDPIPYGANTAKNAKTNLDFTITFFFKKSKERAKWNPDQPVLIADYIASRLNWLEDFTEAEATERTTCYICPEPLLLSVLPISVVSMCYLFPAVLTRLESYLISADVCNLLSLKLDLALALEAITKDSDNTQEHGRKQIHLKRGMGKNYERLEFIGDCFLKMATSISLFSQNPEDDEYDYHVKRMLLICNKNLFRVALDKKLYEYIRSQGFSRRNWYPEDLVLLKGKGHKKKADIQKHQLGDKTVADVCEALIGAALLSVGETGEMDMAVKAVTVLVSNPDHDMSKWSDYYPLYNKPRYQLAQASAAQLDLAAKIEQKHDYHFKYPRLLQSAFIHPSLPTSWADKIPNYQRLEFLGDSLLDMACINFLFHRHPDEDPQWLTEHKMAMVSNKFLSALAAKLEFHRHIRVGGSVVEAQNREYVAELKELEEDGSRDYWTNTSSAPKALSDVVEAYIGAIFVDSEYNYKEVERFFEAHIRWFFEDMSIYDTFANNHPTTLLHFRLNMEYKCEHHRLMAHELPARPAFSTSAEGKVVAVVMIHDEILADAEASSGKNARVRASEKAVKLLEGMSVADFRKRFKCSCGRAVAETEDNTGEESDAPKVEEAVGKNDNDNRMMDWQSESGTKESNVYVAEERKRKADVLPLDETVELESIQKIRIS